MNAILNRVTCWWYKERQTRGHIQRRGLYSMWLKGVELTSRYLVFAALLIDSYPYSEIRRERLSFEANKIWTPWKPRLLTRLCLSMPGVWSVSHVRQTSCYLWSTTEDGYHMSLLPCGYQLWGFKIRFVWLLYVPFIIPSVVSSYSSFLLFNLKYFLFLYYCLNFPVYFDHVLM